MVKFYHWFSSFNEWAAKVGSWCALILTLAVSYDVCMRYFFKAPTIWAFEISWMMYAIQWMLGMGWVLHLNGHIKVDVIYDKFSARTKKILDTLFLLICTLPFCFIVVVYGTPYMLRSWAIREGSHFTLWAPPTYPIKTLIPLVFLMLGVQCILELMRQLGIIKIEEKKEKLAASEGN